MRMDLKEIGREGIWTGLIWLRIVTSGGLWDSCSMTCGDSWLGERTAGFWRRNRIYLTKLRETKKGSVRLVCLPPEDRTGRFHTTITRLW